MTSTPPGCCCGCIGVLPIRTWPTSAHQRWTALLGLALVAFLFASRDAAHRRLPRPVRTFARGRTRRHAAEARGPAVQHPTKSAS